MDRYMFADEAGNFDFSVGQGASRYFVLCTVSADSCDVGDDLLRLRRQLGWRGLHLDFKYVARRLARRDDRLFVVAASLGTKKKRSAFHQAVDDVVHQVSPCRSHRVAFWSMESDPCLQVADYCTWAIQRKWERDDSRSYDLIRDKIRSEKDIWRSGHTHYY